jgi:multiple sugar transport system substrate-binding protein
MHYRRIAVIGVAAATVAGLATACSSSSNSSSSGGSGSSGGGGTGPITYVQGKDNNGVVPGLVSRWNALHPNEKVTVKQQSDSADDQLQDDQQHFQAKDPSYDVVSVDVVWTAQFAAKQWLQPLTGQYAIDTSAMVPPTVKAATYNGTLYAGPASSDGGLLYYRKDLVPTPPATWDQMIADCSKKTAGMGCYAGQYANYEGLTVNVAEAINTAGGEIVKADGKTPNVNTPQAAAGLGFLVNGFKQGYISKDAIGYKETESLNAFTAGKLLFLRNWPYAYKIASGADSKVAGKFGVAPLPGLSADKPGASSLGGHSLAISAYSKHKQTALEFIKFYESAEMQKYFLDTGTQAPVLTATYSDASMVSKYAYLATLLKSISTAVPRPVTPFYSAVTKAIETNSYAALQGQKSTQQALSDMQAAITTAAAGG